MGFRVSAQWYEDDGAERWATEQRIAHQHLLDVKVGHDAGGFAFIQGTLPLLLPCGHELDRFRIKLKYPVHFPARGAHPSAVLESHHDCWDCDSLDAHMPYWHMCLFVPGESGLDFSRDDELVRFLEHVHTFLFRQRSYQRDLARHKALKGPAPEWPGPERAHGNDGLVEALLAMGGRLGRNEFCICGSGRKYKRCHLDELEPLLAQAWAAHWNRKKERK